MKPHRSRPPLMFMMALALACLAAAPASKPTTRPYTRQQDIVYGRTYGTALVLDVFTPTAKPNGHAIIEVVSGGWISSHELLDSPFFAAWLEPFTSRGYTVFAVCHGCQPKFQIPEIVDNMNRSVRFIRYHAKDYGIDPNHIGITGGSAGGHLSLMQGLGPKPQKKDAPDPIDRVSSKVQAVACFFPPTDFLNWGKEGANVLDNALIDPFHAAFDFQEMSDKTHKFERINDLARVSQIEKEVSPIYFVSPDDPPTLISHGDQDKLVPIQQAQSLIEKLKDAKVPAKLIVREGKGHGWPDTQSDFQAFADWFDKYLLPSRTQNTQE